MRAVAALRKVTRLHPGYRHWDGDNPYYYLGKIYEVENRLIPAIIAYSRALSVDYLDEESLIGRATCFTATGQHEAAIYDFEWLLRFPKSRRTMPDKHLFLMLAENNRYLDRWGQAIFWRELAKDAPPGDKDQQLLYEALMNAVKDAEFYRQ